MVQIVMMIGRSRYPIGMYWTNNFQSHFFSACVIVLLILLFPVFTSAEPEQISNTLGNIQPQQESSRIVLTRPDGRILLPGSSIPSYTVRTDGSILLPDGVVIQPDGTIVTVQGTLPEGYTRREDGSIVTPDGTIIKVAPDSPTNKEPSVSSSTQVPIQQAETRQSHAVLHDTTKPTVPDKPLGSEQNATTATPRSVVIQPENPQVTLWQMLPLSEIPEKNEGQQVADAARPRQPVSERPSRKGDPLKIPNDAARKNDLNFLDGCWQTSDLPIYHTKQIWKDLKNPGEKTNTSICFTRKGSGYATFQANGGCRGNVHARFKGNVLLIETDRASCKYSSFIAPRSFECRGSGNKTECQVVANGEVRKRHSVVHFTKQ